MITRASQCIANSTQNVLVFFFFSLKFVLLQFFTAWAFCQCCTESGIGCKNEMRVIWGPFLCVEVCRFQLFLLCFLWLCPFVVNTLKLKGEMLLCCEQMLHTCCFSLIGHVGYIPICYPATFTTYWKQLHFRSVPRLSAVKTQVVMLFVCVWMRLQAFPKQLEARVNFVLFFFSCSGMPVCHRIPFPFFCHDCMSWFVREKWGAFFCFQRLCH